MSWQLVREYSRNSLKFKNAIRSVHPVEVLLEDYIKSIVSAFVPCRLPCTYRTLSEAARLIRPCVSSATLKVMHKTGWACRRHTTGVPQRSKTQKPLISMDSFSTNYLSADKNSNEFLSPLGSIPASFTHDFLSGLCDVQLQSQESNNGPT